MVARLLLNSTAPKRPPRDKIPETVGQNTPIRSTPTARLYWILPIEQMTSCTERISGREPDCARSQSRNQRQS